MKSEWLRSWRRLRTRTKTKVAATTAQLLNGNRTYREVALAQLAERHFKPGTLCLVPFDDHAIYVDPRDQMIGAHILSGHTWHRETLQLAIDIAGRHDDLDPQSTFLEVGANIGTQTIYALVANAFGKAIAIEADPENFDILRKNLVLNGFTQRATAVHCAASDRLGSVQLYKNSSNFGANSLEAGLADGQTRAVTVDAMPVDDVVAAQGIRADEIGMVWIDVEGHELSVLAGMSRTLSSSPPLALEFTARHHGAEGVKTLRNLLAPHYTHVVNMRSLRPDLQRFDDLDFSSRQYDLLFLRRQR